MGTVYFEASAHFINLRPFGIMFGCVPTQGRIAKYVYTWEEN
jgi:hypothetical protein